MSAIQVVPYDDAWRALFEEEREKLMGLIVDLIADIQHIASTSITGLSAKPKIDIDAVLSSAAEAVERVKGLPELTSTARLTMTACGPSFHGGPRGEPGSISVAQTTPTIRNAFYFETGSAHILMMQRLTLP